MEQSTFAVIISMLIIFVFLPAFYLRGLNSNKQIINESLYLAARSIEDCVEENDISMEQISMGYQYAKDPVMRIKIDEAKLLTEFEDVLFRCLNNPRKFNKVQQNIVCKMIIYPDRYVVLDDTTYAYLRDNSGNYNFDQEGYNYQDEVNRYLKGEKTLGILAPKYFTYSNKDGNIEIKKTGDPDPSNKAVYFINTMNDVVKRADTPNKAWGNITDKITDFSGPGFNMQTGESVATERPLTTYDKNQAIINMINKEIMYRTNGVKMKITNPANLYEKNTEKNTRDFSFFEGITFLIIYREDNVVLFKDEQYKFNQYNMVGYTLIN